MCFGFDIYIFLMPRCEFGAETNFGWISFFSGSNISRNASEKELALLGVGNCSIKGDLLYSFREHSIQAIRRNSSRRGVCGLNLFSHLRSIVCRFERSGDISAPKHRISPTVVLDIQALAWSSTCPGDARRFLRRRIIIFLTVMSTCFLSKFALWACCVSLYPGRCNRVIAGGSFSFLGSSRSAYHSNVQGAVRGGHADS